MRTSIPSLSQQALGASAATLLTLLISGCGMGIADSSTSTSVVAPTVSATPGSISGSVHGGQQPIVGATVQLYEVGSTGYTSGMAKPLIATTSQSGSVNSVAITNGGSGYTSNFAVTFGGAGTGATGTAVVSGGAVVSVTITAGGSGYTAASTVSFGNGTGTGAAGLPLILGTDAGGVTSVAVTAGGSGYTSNFAVTFGGSGSGATGTAIVSSGAVASVTITAAGTGYTSGTTVSFANGSGTGATGTPSISGNALTDAQGNFSITGDYSCDAGSYVYIAGYGGSPGAGSVNPNIALVAALGPCSVLKANAATTSLNIDEVTTVAAAYALAQFTGNSTFGTPLFGQPGVSGSQAPADNFTTSSTNTQGIANAMAIAKVLANTTTGSSPGSNTNASATPEYWAINSIADMLAACVNSTSPFTTCTNLYSYVNPLGGSVVPADTLQAALALAQSPTVASANVTNLYNLIGTNPQFQPAVTSASQIHDFTIGISYNPVVPGTSTLLLTDPFVVSFDQYGNAWFTTQQGSTTVDNYVVELDPTGNPIPAGSTSVGGTSASNYEITTYSCGANCTIAGSQGSGTGNSTTSATYEGILSATKYYIGMAADTNNNMWVADFSLGNVMVVPGSGAVYTGSGTVSTYNGGNYNGTSNQTTAAYGYGIGTYVSGGNRTQGIAIDGSNDVFVSNTADPSYGTNGTGYTNINKTTHYKGITEFVGGSPGNVSYVGLQNSPTDIAISSGTLDTVGGSAITGSPFVWVSLSADSSTTSDGYLDQLYSKPTSITGAIGTGQGMLTPYSANTANTAYGIGGPLQTSPAIWTTIPNSAGSFFTTNSLGNPTGDTPTSPFATIDNASDVYAIVTDGTGHLWASNFIAALDFDNEISNGITKITPSYTTPVYGTTAGAYNSDFSYVIYHDEAGMISAQTTYYSGGSSTTNEPRYLATDGAGDIFFTINLPNTIGAITNTGTPLSGNSGFLGISAPTGADFTGTSTTYARATSVNEIQIDQSGNLWMPQQSPTIGNLTMLVGIGAPLSQPASAAFAAGTYGLKP